MPLRLLQIYTYTFILLFLRKDFARSNANVLEGKEINSPTSKSVSGGDEETLQTSAMMMNQIVEV